MLRRTTDQAFALYQRTSNPRALARVFDDTAAELLKLARHLASGEAGAEDLVQATFVTAIEASQTHRTGEPVLPWLIGILGNHARAARRQSRRALDASRATHDDTIDPARDAERRELLGAVTDTIASLPELYRPVLRLYLEQGLEPAEIARALERPQGTVRAQVHRGLDLLRAGLPAALGAGATLAAEPARGLAAVREAVVAPCGEQVGGAVAAGTATFLGVLTMTNLKVTLSVAAVAVAALFVGKAFYGSDADPSAGSQAAPPAAIQVDAATPSSAAIVDAASETSRTPILGTPVPSTAAKTSLRVIVQIGRKQAPEAAAGIAVRVQPLALMQDPQSVGDPVLTDEQGIAEFTDVAPGGTWVRIDRAEVRQFVAIEAGKQHEVRVRIPQGIRVTGVVRDGAGQPVAGARVLAHAISMEPDLVATTDAQGAFTVNDLAANVALQARAKGHAPSFGLRVQGKAGSDVHIDLALGARARRLTGQVRDADGVAVGGARVAIIRAEVSMMTPGKPFPFALFARADADGHFVVEELAPEAMLVVGMPARDSTAAPGVATVAAATTDATADVRLRRGATLHGVVSVDAKRRGDLSVQAWAEQPVETMGYLLNLLGMRLATVSKDGTYRMTGLLPGHYQLRVISQQLLASHALEIAEGGDHEWSPYVGQGALTVRVTPPVPPKGLAVPMWAARLYRRAKDGNLEFLNFAMAGSDGTVKFAAIEPGATYDVVLAMSLGRGQFNSVIVAHQRDVVAQAAPHQLTLDATTLPSAYVRGRLVDANGSPRGNAEILARAQVSDILVSYANTLTAPDGRFDVGPLPPGAWTLLLGTDPTAPTLGEHQLAADQSLDLGDVIH